MLGVVVVVGGVIFRGLVVYIRCLDLEVVM